MDPGFRNLIQVWSGFPRFRTILFASQLSRQHRVRTVTAWQDGREAQRIGLTKDDGDTVMRRSAAFNLDHGYTDDKIAFSICRLRSPRAPSTTRRYWLEVGALGALGVARSEVTPGLAVN